MRAAPLILCLAAACTGPLPSEPFADVDAPSLAEDLGRALLQGVLAPRAFAPAPDTPPTQLQIVASVSDPGIGADAPGRVAWFARTARFAVLAHPDPRGPSCEPVNHRARHQLHDLETGAHERLDRIVASDPRGRYLVFHAGTHLWLLDGDTGTRSELAARGAALLDRGDPCSVERRAAFDELGRHLVYLRGARGHEQVVWHDLASGREHTVAVPDAARPLWRAEPSSAPGWLRLFSVPRDSNNDGRRSFPRLAHAHDPHRPHADAVVSHTLTTADDARTIVGTGGRADHGFTPLGGDLFAPLDPRGRWLSRTTAGSFALPPECDGGHGLDGLPAVLLRCLGERRLWWPHTGHSLELPDGELLDATQRSADGHLWRAAQVKLGPDATHLLRIDTTTAAATLGPRILLGLMHDAEPALHSDRAGWLYFNNPAGLLAMHITSGRTLVHLGALARRLRPGAAELQGRWYALDPANTRMFALPRAPAAVADNGCALVGADERGQHGPWTRHCPQP